MVSPKDIILILNLERGRVEIEMHQLLVLRDFKLHRRLWLRLHEKEGELDTARGKPADVGGSQPAGDAGKDWSASAPSPSSAALARCQLRARLVAARQHRSRLNL